MCPRNLYVPISDIDHNDLVGAQQRLSFAYSLVIARRCCARSPLRHHRVLHRGRSSSISQSMKVAQARQQLRPLRHVTSLCDTIPINAIMVGGS